MLEIKDFEPLFSSWYVESLIGSGSFGKVYKIKREEFGTIYCSALKWISIPRDEAEMKQLRYDGLDNSSISEHYKDAVYISMALMRKSRKWNRTVLKKYSTWYM